MTRAKRTLEVMTKDTLNVGRTIARGGMQVGIATGKTVQYLGTPHIIPTMLRKADDYSKNNPEKNGVMTSAIFGQVPIFLIEFCTYLGLALNRSPKWLYIPLATNAISLLYEWGRNSYIRAGERR
ncbi:MAG: hypothetical protein ABIH49_02525 [archaeon]